MTYEVVVQSVPAQVAAVVSARVPGDGIADFLGGVFAEVLQVAQAQGAAPIGPPFARYAVAEQEFEVTAGFPVSSPITASGRVVPNVLPAGDIATAVHRGSYEQIPEAFHAVIEWIERNGREIVSDPWESYLDGPEVQEPRTVVCFPLKPLS